MSEKIPYVFYFEINTFNDLDLNTIVPYTKDPQFVQVENQEHYSAPTVQDLTFNDGKNIYAYYNVEPFSPDNVFINTSIPLENSQIKIYEYSYNLSDDDLTNPDLQYQILDLLSVQNTLFATFSQTFLSDINCETTVLSMMQIIRKYCNLNATMNSPLCCFTQLNFPNVFFDASVNVSTSPCTNSYLDCAPGWSTYCSKPENYQSTICQDFYTNSYLDDGDLDFRAKDTLENACQQVYVDTLDKTKLDDYYLNFCGCHLPFDIYFDFQKQYDLINESVGPIQCWYLPCINCSFPPILPQKNPCPNSDISNCIQESYIDIGTTGNGNINSNNIIVNQTIQHCKDPSATPPPSETLSPDQAQENIDQIQNQHTFQQPIDTIPYDPITASISNTVGTTSVNMALVLIAALVAFTIGAIIFGTVKLFTS